MGLDYALRRRGPLTMAPSQLGVFTRSDPSRERANIQFHVQPLSLDKFGEPLHTVSGFHRQRLQSAARPAAARAAALGRSGRHAGDPAELSVDRRRTAASPPIRSASRARSSAQPALRIPAGRISAGRAGADDDEAALAKAAGDIGTTIFHPVGTAKMGRTTIRGVVDARLRVLGIEGLRVIDASVMPTITSGNTNSPTMMIAEKGAAMMREDAKPIDARIPAQAGRQLSASLSDGRVHALRGMTRCGD